jgi:hypothetical protein
MLAIKTMSVSRPNPTTQAKIIASLVEVSMTALCAARLVPGNLIISD